jgi:hypothetical protein
MVIIHRYGLDLKLPHDSVVWEDAANLRHATGRIQKLTSSPTNHVARLAVVGYKHEGLFFPNHGYHEVSPMSMLKVSTVSFLTNVLI